MSNEPESITDLQHVRRCPSMYFGDLGAPSIANCLAKEAYCLAIDLSRVTIQWRDHRSEDARW